MSRGWGRGLRGTGGATARELLPNPSLQLSPLSLGPPDCPLPPPCTRSPTSNATTGGLLQGPSCLMFLTGT